MEVVPMAQAQRRAFRLLPDPELTANATGSKRELREAKKRMRKLIQAAQIQDANAGRQNKLKYVLEVTEKKTGLQKSGAPKVHRIKRRRAT